MHVCAKKWDGSIVEAVEDEEYFEDLGPHEQANLNMSEQSEENSNEEAVGQQPVKGTCISCQTAYCDIILVPCFHIVICSKCWSDKISAHEKQCEITFKNNKRKMALEKKKIPCPCCDGIVNRAQEFFMATINS